MLRKLIANSLVIGTRPTVTRLLKNYNYLKIYYKIINEKVNQDSEEPAELSLVLEAC